MIKTIEINPDILASCLAAELSMYVDDFVEMEWSGNPYTGEGTEYPKINVEALTERIRGYLNK